MMPVYKVDRVSAFRLPVTYIGFGLQFSEHSLCSSMAFEQGCASLRGLLELEKAPEEAY